jgi:hypothetical protein
MNYVLAAQYQNAFEFVQKVFYETSYLIKEIEGILQQEEEPFFIGRPSGYQVTTRTSSGLEPINVEYWQPRTLTVFFGTEKDTISDGGVTKTIFHNLLKLLVVHIELLGKNQTAPRIICGCLKGFTCKRPEKIKKIEHVFAKFAYYPQKIFGSLPKVSYTDADCSFEGTFFDEPLFSINNSEDVMKKLVQRMLRLYRE